MHEVLRGIKVVEVASWTFVPAAGAVLADWGADVLKVEHPVTGDPQRGLISSGLVPAGPGGVNYMMEQPNRGKRSVALNLGTDDGRELLYRLAETADVFLTNFLPDARERLLIDVDHIRARNPDIIYVRGTGQGVRGPDARKGGYDGASYWARGGLAMALTPGGLEWPISPRPAFGDVMGGMTIAGGIAAALFHRERTGEPSIVDVSLLGLALWNLGPDVVASKLYETTKAPRFDRAESPNPIVGVYRTQDGRFISLMMLESDRYWADFCRHIERPELIDDPRFKDAATRYENRRACIGVLDEVFASRPFAEWRSRLSTLEGVWAPMQTVREVHDDPQAVANGYLPSVTSAEGTEFTLVANPVQFDETSPDLSHAPDHGQHTEEVLLELGLTWPEIAAHKESGAIL
jgi:crotonobetainyl-CoA:carnitine CoA-transferase CaiB-like acyl-CoA transferase